MSLRRACAFGRLRWSWSALVLLALPACDPVTTVRAVVVDSSGAPVEGAHVQFTCPHALGDGLEAVSGADGRFLASKIPDIDEACTMTLTKPGFASRVLTRADVAYTKGAADTGAPLPRVTLTRSK